MEYWDSGHPHRWRTWLRTHLPWWIINLGVAEKAENCEAVGGKHWWYNLDGKSSACYHCSVIREGHLWESSHT